jgi:hypothetical protein
MLVLVESQCFAKFDTPGSKRGLVDANLASAEVHRPLNFGLSIRHAFFQGIKQGCVRTDNASRGFFRQRIAMILSPRTDSASRGPEAVTSASRGTRAPRPLLSPRPMALGNWYARPMENPAKRCEKRWLRVTSTGAVERSEAMAPASGGGQDRDQPAPGVAIRIDIPGDDAVAVRRLSGPRDALSVRT